MSYDQQIRQNLNMPRRYAMKLGSRPADKDSVPVDGRPDRYYARALNRYTRKWEIYEVLHFGRFEPDVDRDIIVEQRETDLVIVSLDDHTTSGVD